ncbi:MAG: nicotinamide riboside transporter PnuC [Candidatus Malihini olakiniferum]
MDFFSTSNILIHIPLGAGGYDLSWIEAVGTFCGLLCIWLASLEKTINYLFGLINVSLFAVIFFQIQLYASLLLQIFFFVANVYGWYAWTRRTDQHDIALKIRWLPLPRLLAWSVLGAFAIGLMTVYVNAVFAALTRIAVAIPTLKPDAFPLWDSIMMVLSMIAMVLMTRKYLENWILWIVVNIISVVIFTYQGVYVMAVEYLILTGISLNGTWLWIKEARQCQAPSSTQHHV